MNDARRWPALLVAAALIVLAGCGAAQPQPPSPTPTPSSSASVAGGVSLADLGVRNEPAARIVVPTSARLMFRIDQDAMLVATFDPAGRDEILAFERENLPALGFRVAADGTGGLLFEDDRWSGAISSNDRQVSITVRARKS